MSILKNKKKYTNQGHSPMKHMLHMILCCGIPIIIIFSLPFIASFSPALAGILGVVAPFICPVLMGGMLFMMFRSNKHSCCDENKTEIDHESPRNN